MTFMIQMSKLLRCKNGLFNPVDMKMKKYMKTVMDD